MKTLSKLLIFNLLTSFVVNAEEVLGKKLEEDLPEATEEINFEEIKKNDQLSIEEVISHGDAFLKETFGKDFKPKIFHVCLVARSVKGGKIWCWTIDYQHPEDGDFEDQRIFSVCLSTRGKPLMKVRDK